MQKIYREAGAEAEAAMQMLSKVVVRKKLRAFTENRWRCLSCIFEAKKSSTSLLAHDNIQFTF